MRCSVLMVLAVALSAADAQPPAPVVSPEVGPDRRVTFRLRADVPAVLFEGGDLGQPQLMVKGEDGVWSLTLGPIAPGAYRYGYLLSGTRVLDPTNPLTVANNANASSLLIVPGSDLIDERDVPHGAVAELYYPSSLGWGQRRLHVYTPPGYEAGAERYPVLYLLHGASDSDASWTGVGRANFILDNLIAAGRAKPMVVVMPNGHRGRFDWGRMETMGDDVLGLPRELEADIRPLMERRYRVLTEPAQRAVAGLSMGGAQALAVSLYRPADYAWVGIFSSGNFALQNDDAVAAWTAEQAAALAAAKAAQRLVWIGIGRDDFLLDISRRTTGALQAAGWPVDTRETDGGHTWANWRDYLADLLPRLFAD